MAHLPLLVLRPPAVLLARFEAPDRFSVLPVERAFQESQVTGTSKAAASLAMVSGVPVRRPLSRSER